MLLACPSRPSNRTFGQQETARKALKTAKYLNLKLFKYLNIFFFKSPTFVGGPRGLERAGGRRRRRSDPLHRDEEVVDLDGAGGGAELSDQLADLAVQL